MKEIAHADRCLCVESPLHPEKSVPVTGFSRELRMAVDTQRYWFSFALRGDVPLPVHLVFSPTEGVAEVKAADLKAYRVVGVSSPCEARERWVAWWKTGRRPFSFGVPRRTGNFPIRTVPAS